jgi:hypothetical protein
LEATRARSESKCPLLLDTRAVLLRRRPHLRLFERDIHLGECGQLGAEGAHAGVAELRTRTPRHHRRPCRNSRLQVQMWPGARAGMRGQSLFQQADSGECSSIRRRTEVERACVASMQSVQDEDRSFEVARVALGPIAFLRSVRRPSQRVLQRPAAQATRSRFECRCDVATSKPRYTHAPERQSANSVQTELNVCTTSVPLVGCSGLLDLVPLLPSRRDPV